MQSISRDGKLIAVVADAVAWIHRNHSFSYAHAVKHEGYKVATVTKWPETEARQLRAISRQLFKHGDWEHTGDLERESCSACVLRGFLSESSKADRAAGHDDSAGPNYAGWARVYVEAGEIIPPEFRAAFEAERKRTDNLAYVEALERSIATFGVRVA